MSKSKLKVLSPVHTIHPHLLDRRVSVALVGCGGNGSQMLTRLARLDFALRELGHPGGFMVYAFDPDTVSASNVGRQLFSPSDVGLFKCQVLIHRLNCYYGLDWKAEPRKYDGRIESFLGAFTTTQPELIITCVDTAAARREVHLGMTNDVLPPRYWLDLGNRKAEGQVILGQPRSAMETGTISGDDFVAGRGREAVRKQADAKRLPTVVDIFPELLDDNFEEDDEPSCSLRDALDRQSLFVNDHMTTWAAQLLDTLFRAGQIEYHGAFISLETGRVNPLRVPEVTR